MNISGSTDYVNGYLVTWNNRCEEITIKMIYIFTEHKEELSFLSKTEWTMSKQNLIYLNIKMSKANIHNDNNKNRK